MINPHPPLTAFPLVLTTMTLAAECLSRWYRPKDCRRFAAVLLRILCVAAPATYFSGYIGAEYASQTFEVDPELIASHQSLAKFFLISLVPLLALSIAISSEDEQPAAWLRLVYLAFLWLSFFLVLFTGAQGGDLVFRYGAGVQAPLPGASASGI